VDPPALLGETDPRHQPRTDVQPAPQTSVGDGEGGMGSTGPKDSDRVAVGRSSESAETRRSCRETGSSARGSGPGRGAKPRKERESGRSQGRTTSQTREWSKALEPRGFVGMRRGSLPATEGGAGEISTGSGTAGRQRSQRCDAAAHGETPSRGVKATARGIVPSGLVGDLRVADGVGRRRKRAEPRNWQWDATSPRVPQRRKPSRW
jgi:hypothetical protein